MSECHHILTFFLPEDTITANLSLKQAVCSIGTDYDRRAGLNLKSFKILLNINRTKMAKVNIKPLADRVLVEPAAAEQKTAGGIIIPDTAKEKPQKGTVVAVGNGKKDEPMTVKVGDKVLYGKYSGSEITVDGADYLIMRESDILAIV
jgi:chaperonin GroES